MDTLQKKFDAVIEEALTEKSFSLEIVNRIKSLKDDFEQTQKDLTQAQETIKEKAEQITDLTKERNGLKGDLEKAQKKLEEWDAREEILKKRELSTQLLEQRVQLIDQSKSEMFALVSSVFRNPVYIRRVNGQEVVVPTTGPNGVQNWPTTMPTSETVTESIE